MIDASAVTAYTAKRLADKRVLECLALVFWDMPESGLDEAVEELRAIRDHWRSIDLYTTRPECEHDFAQVPMAEDGVEKCRKCNLLTKRSAP